ncbi:MAG: oxidoreductase [Acidimicrobiaceae bacterium]|nr:oxidoreductase [Acidimicrobiaceae bacterium]
MRMTGWGSTLIEPVSPERDHIRGPQRAPVTLLEYGDFECPYCGAAHPVVEAVRATMGQSLSFAFRHFPLTTVHPHAWSAAEAAESAGAQSHFWQMHDLLFEDQRHLNAPDLIARALALDIDVDEFTKALAADAFADRIQADVMSGVRSGVPGTPTFFVNGIRFGGSPDYESLLSAVQIVGARAT